MVFNRDSLPRSAAEAPGFFLGAEYPTAVKAPGADISIDPLLRVPRKIDAKSDFAIMRPPP
jgi:hypothetical protein